MSEKTKQKTLLKYFLVLAAIFLIIFNWGYISWFFNYNTIGENMSYLARKVFGINDISLNISNILAMSQSTPSSGTATDNTNSQAGSNTANQHASPQKSKTTQDITPSSKPNSIEIPSIKVKAPVIITASQNQKVFNSILKRGVLFYPGSVLPGEKGASIILGHSSPPNWPRVNYDRVFNDLEKLKPNNEILLDFQGEIYKYQVRRIFWVNGGEDLSPYLTFEKSMLLLVSCWPPGKNAKRIVVEAELI